MFCDVAIVQLAFLGFSYNRYLCAKSWSDNKKIFIFKEEFLWSCALQQRERYKGITHDIQYKVISSSTYRYGLRLSLLIWPET